MSVPVITRFSYGTSVPVTATVSESRVGFIDMASTLQTCYYSAPQVNITIADLSNFLTKVTPISLTTGSAATTIGSSLKNNVTIANLIADINTKSQLDKRWTTGTGNLDTFWIDFYGAIGDVDVDLTTVTPKADDVIQFVFRFDATVSGGLNGITPSETITTTVGETTTTVYRFLVGHTFKITA
jgi:hypothetical protein